MIRYSATKRTTLWAVYGHEPSALGQSPVPASVKTGRLLREHGYGRRLAGFGDLVLFGHITQQDQQANRDLVIAGDRQGVALEGPGGRRCRTTAIRRIRLPGCA